MVLLDVIVPTKPLEAPVVMYLIAVSAVLVVSIALSLLSEKRK